MSQDKTGIERRKYLRVPTDLKVRSRVLGPVEMTQLLPMLGDAEPKIPDVGVLSRSGGQIKVAAVDISEGGLSAEGDLVILGEQVFPEGKDLVVEMDLNDGKGPLKAVAQVVWSVKDDAEKKCRAGLMFTVISETNLNRIKEHVQEKIAN